MDKLDLHSSLFLTSVCFKEDLNKENINKLEPDYELHIGKEEKEMLQRGAKIVCRDLPTNFTFAKTAHSFQLKKIANTNKAEYIPLFSSYNALIKIHGENTRIGIISVKTAMKTAQKENLAGVVIDPGTNNIIITEHKKNIE